MSETSGKWVNTLLDQEMLEKFEAVKRYHGINTSSDMIRFLVLKEARAIADDAPLFAAPVRDRVEAS